jgi:hypothetical protein
MNIESKTKKIMLALFLTHHIPRVAQASSATPPNIKEVIGTSLGITAAILGIFATILYIWADYKDNKEIDDMLRKNGIIPKKTGK